MALGTDEVNHLLIALLNCSTVDEGSKRHMFSVTAVGLQYNSTDVLNHITYLGHG